MQKGYAAEPLVAGSIPVPLTKIHYGIVHRRPKWGSPPTVKVDLFTYRVRLRGRAEGSSTWISERHRPGRRNDSTKASCLDIKASLGALYKGRIAQLAERTHLADSSVILVEGRWFESTCGHKASERKGLPKAGESSSDSFGVCFTHSIYSYYWGA